MPYVASGACILVSIGCFQSLTFLWRQGRSRVILLIGVRDDGVLWSRPTLVSILELSEETGG